MEWAGGESSLPSPRWVWMLWTFLREEFERIRAKQTGPVDDEELAKVLLRISQAFMPLISITEFFHHFYSHG